jgi:hypothetical protein
LAIAWVGAWDDYNLFGSTGLMIGVNGLLQILSGFFITSLAAIATFNGSTYKIDEVLEGEKALLDGEALTRRQFLCFLFSYLALTSLVLYFFGAFGISGASTLHDSVTGLTRTILRAVYAGVYALVLGHVLGTTLIGLIFLAGRIPGSTPPARFVAAPRSASSPSTAQARGSSESDIGSMEQNPRR